METKYIVNNATGQTINGDITINGGLTITGDTSIRPYKVYTALLTQSGGDDLQILASGTLTIGITYQIKDSGEGFDFTNVGAPNNDYLTFFVATGTTPANWGDGGQLYYNTGAPVVTVLENTIGDIWFTYSNIGQYVVNSNGLFIENKTTVFGGFYDGNLGVWVNFNNSGLNSTNNIFIQIGDPLPASGYLNNTPIEIRVYN